MHVQRHLSSLTATKDSITVPVMEHTTAPAPDQAPDQAMLEYVRQKLIDSKGRWPIIAKETDVAYFTIASIVNKAGLDPRIGSIQPLYNYFRAKEQGQPAVAAG